jgi:hypothetical protein
MLPELVKAAANRVKNLNVRDNYLILQVLNILCYRKVSRALLLYDAVIQP